MATITAKKRDVKESLSRLRSSGSIPAVFYGPKEASTPISVDSIQFNKVLSESGESSVISLIGEAGEHDVLVHDISRDPVSGIISHIDFYVMEKGKKVKVNVPVEFVGVSAAVKEMGAILVKVMHEVEIEAMPKDLPHNLEVDISKIIDLDSHVTAGDIKLPSGVTLITEAEEIVALAKMPKEEEEESAPVDLSSIEVEKKGKTESEEGAETTKK
ncbi:MAG: 50S ribosomal protein L25 [Candidatus Paceibacterota bacterium]